MVDLFPFFYIACLLIAMILLLNMISQAFKRGVLWGVLCVLFPAGTIVYCKKHWSVAKSLAIPLLILLIGSVVLKLLIMTIE